MSEQLQAITVARRNAEEVQSKGDFALFDRLFADDYVDHTPQPGFPPTKDGTRALYRAMRHAFPDFVAEVHFQFSDGDRVATYKTYHGTHLQPFMGRPASGKQVHFDTVDVMRVRNGQIVAHWGVGDLLGLLQQLGIVPPVSLDTRDGEVKQHHRARRGKALARSYDYVIVGAGSAGCVVARRLVEGSDATVLLLEAGGPGEGSSLSNPPQWVENVGSRYDWAYRYEPSPHVAGRSIPLSLGKVLGGSGSINAMVWTRGHRADYDGWKEAGNPLWHFTSVLPMFKKAEDWEDGASEFRGGGGPIHVERARELHPVAAAFIEAGLSYGMPYLDDLNIPEPEGVGPMNLNIKGGLRCSPADAYLRPVMGHRNLTVLTEAPAVKLTLTGMRCTGVEFRLDGQLWSVGASHEVILCAGAIHTPRLLLLSGVGPHADLELLGIDTVIDLPGVGRNLQDHLWIMGLCFEANLPQPAPNYNLAGSAGFWKSRPALDRPDLMVMPGQVPLVSDEIAARFPIPPNAFVILPCLVRPRSRGYLRLRTADPEGPLEIQPNFLAEEADVEALASGVELGLDLASQPAYRELIKRWVVPPRRMSREDTVGFVRHYCSSYLHPVGTCAIGSSRDAVVDGELRVHGIEGLRIADASVMPTIPSANTNAPSIMIGEFASRLLVVG